MRPIDLTTGLVEDILKVRLIVISFTTSAYERRVIDSAGIHISCTVSYQNS